MKIGLTLKKKKKHSSSLGCRAGIVVRAVVSHQCGPSSISRLSIIRGLSLFVLFSALEGFSLGYFCFPLS